VQFAWFLSAVTGTTGVIALPFTSTAATPPRARTSTASRAIFIENNCLLSQAHLVPYPLVKIVVTAGVSKRLVSSLPNIPETIKKIGDR